MKFDHWQDLVQKNTRLLEDSLLYHLGNCHVSSTVVYEFISELELLNITTSSTSVGCSTVELRSEECVLEFCYQSIS